MKAKSFISKPGCLTSYLKNPNFSADFLMLTSSIAPYNFSNKSNAKIDNSGLDAKPSLPSIVPSHFLQAPKVF